MTDRPGAVQDLSDRPWLDAGRPVGARVAALLAAMTLEEKVGQLVQVCRPDPVRDADVALLAYRDAEGRARYDGGPFTIRIAPCAEGGVTARLDVERGQTTT